MLLPIPSCPCVCWPSSAFSLLLSSFPILCRLLFWWWCGHGRITFHQSLEGCSGRSPISAEQFYSGLWHLSGLLTFCCNVYERWERVSLAFAFQVQTRYCCGRKEKKVVALGWLWCISLSLYFALCQHFFRSEFRSRKAREGAWVVRCCDAPAANVRTSASNWRN